MTLLIIFFLIAIGVSFLCSVLEAVLLSISPVFTEKLKQDKRKSQSTVSKVRENLDESLAAILILNTFAHTIGAFGVGSQALLVFGKQWETLVAVVLTLAILYFSEIIPKTLGAKFWRLLAVPSCITIYWLVKLVYPLVWLGTLLTKLFKDKNNEKVTREEILAMVSLGRKGGALESQEIQYLSNILALQEVTTENVLTPRTVVHMIPEDQIVSMALEDPSTRRFSRIPIYDENSDDVTGKVLRSDLYEAERAGKGNHPVSEFAIPILRISERLPVQQLLDLLIKNRVHLVLVEDEFGQTAGIVTLEDAIETLLGREIVDESDQVEDMQDLAKRKYRDRLRENKRTNGN